jgi:hypothetical protein
LPFLKIKAMALNIRIDFNNRYEHSFLAKDKRLSTFESILIDGSTVKLGIKISRKQHTLMPGVYNLSFGPIDKKFNIDTRLKFSHKDHSKVFSTVLFAGLSYLNENKGKILGFDGSNTPRAYMYYRCILNNFEYLNAVFDIYGVNYYSRIFRDDSQEYGGKDLFIDPMPIDPRKKIHPQKLFNYFTFKKKIY